VNLVGVVSAEEGLNFPDFRSAERTFQQLTQVAGRSGRTGNTGAVVIQTYSPDHAVFRHLVAHDYDGFMREEMETRRALNYPPFARLVLACCTAADAGLLGAFMESWASAARALLAKKSVAVLGPTPPLVPRVKNRYREQMLLKGAIQQADKDAVLAAFKDLVGRGRGRSGIDLRWDVDPEAFL
jgi:primosomal protein N' (replication factor Y)